MSLARLISEAEQVVSSVQRGLPDELRRVARQVPVIYYDWPAEVHLGDEFDSDILGLFVGEPHSAEQGAAAAAPTHILLFLENIFSEAEEDLQKFRDEVRVTYLHELGHYLGWDEDDLDARGLS